MRTKYGRGMHVLLGISLALLLIGSAHLGEIAAQPKGQMTWALHFTIAPTYFDPAETPGIITPFLFLYALHDALVKPMPGNSQAPSLAESWRESEDGLTYEFTLRKGIRFHNGDTFTAEDVKRDPKLTLAYSYGPAVFFIFFNEQWDPKSPWHDIRVRQVRNYAIDRQALNEQQTLGASSPTANIVPRVFEFALPLEAYPYDPEKAKQLLKEAGYANGFDAGEISSGPPYHALAEGVATYLQSVGIRIKVRPMERAAFVAAWKEKKLPGLTLGGTGAFGNAAVRLEPFARGGGDYAKGSYPDIDELFKKQSTERDRKKREAMLHEIQRLVHERAMYAPLFELGWPNGVGPRVAESGFGLIPLFYYTGPYEDIRLKE